MMIMMTIMMMMLITIIMIPGNATISYCELCSSVVVVVVLVVVVLVLVLRFEPLLFILSSVFLKSN